MVYVYNFLITEDNMKLETGYVYHIKNDNKLMTNHEETATRPNHFCIKRGNSNLLWFIPMSSKVCKFKKIIEKKVQNTGRCDTIVIGNYRNRDTAFLLQNMFPITEKYIDHIDTANGIAQKLLVELAKKNNSRCRPRDIFIFLFD